MDLIEKPTFLVFPLKESENLTTLDAHFQWFWRNACFRRVRLHLVSHGFLCSRLPSMVTTYHHTCVAIFYGVKRAMKCLLFACFYQKGKAKDYLGNILIFFIFLRNILISWDVKNILIFLICKQNVRRIQSDVIGLPI